ncbi:MAG: hypothetical protein LBP59_00675 [Planctomycetaceae bacterium]|jgi:tetratricopeptide (TPR) repeat protein|nr:hypothetical protein [Planctomycetaceae bacterium]
MNLKSEHVNQNLTLKGRQIFLFLFLFLLIILLATSAMLLFAAENQSNKQKNENILRQDILRFVGPVSESLNFTIPDDAYLIRLNPKRFTISESGKPPAVYNMLIRNIDPVEKALLKDAQDGKWDNFDLFRAAIIAEGERNPAKINNYESKLDAILQKTKNNNPIPDEIFIRNLFEALHGEMMYKYDINCTNVSNVFETGKFNCVSATVLFNVLGEKANLKIHAIEMPEHVLSRMNFQNKQIDVETTCPKWFRIDNKEDLAAATLQRVAKPEPATPNPIAKNNINEKNNQNILTQSEQVEKLSRNSRDLTSVQLIAIIYYNTGIDLEKEERYPEAIIANLKALHLDPESENAWKNLLVPINNWAIKLSNGNKTNGIKRYDLAAILLDQGVYLDPKYENFKINQLHIYYHWIHDLAVNGQIDAAKEVFSYADKRLPNNPILAKLMNTINEQATKNIR